jgi:hypothetical protein
MLVRYPIPYRLLFFMPVRQKAHATSAIRTHGNHPIDMTNAVMSLFRIPPEFLFMIFLSPGLN